MVCISPGPTRYRPPTRTLGRERDDADVDDLYAFHRGNGVEIAQPIGDRPWHIRDYTVRDLNGYHIVFGQHLLNAGPPITIERVDLPRDPRLQRRHDFARDRYRVGRLMRH